MSNSQARSGHVQEEKLATSRQKSARTSAQALGTLTDSFSGTSSDIEFCDKSGFFRRQKIQQRSLVAQLAQQQGNRHVQQVLTTLAAGVASQNSAKEHSGVELSNQERSSNIIMTKPAKRLYFKGRFSVSCDDKDKRTWFNETVPEKLDVWVEEQLKRRSIYGDQASRYDILSRILGKIREKQRLTELEVGRTYTYWLSFRLNEYHEFLSARVAIKEAAPSPIKPTEQDNTRKRYDVSMFEPKAENVTEQEALEVLRKHHQRLQDSVVKGKDDHELSIKLKKEHPFVSFFSELVSGSGALPESDIWKKPQYLLDLAKQYLDKGPVRQAKLALLYAGMEYCDCLIATRPYRLRTSAGVEGIKQTLKWTAESGKYAALLLTVKFPAAGGALYAVYGELNDQIEKMETGQQPTAFDWYAITAKGVTGATVGAILDKFVKGPLKEWFNQRMGSYLSRSIISNAELKALGITREAFMTTGQTVIIHLLAEGPAAPLRQAMVSIVARILLKEKLPADADEFLNMVLEDLFSREIAIIIVKGFLKP